MHNDRELQQTPKFSSINAVAQHYNSIPVVDLKTRQDSIIIGLKRFNNWLKAVLISNFTRPRDKVLDLGCGKGGDLTKWTKQRVDELVGIDIAEKSIQEATDRYNTMSFRNFRARFYTLDCFSFPIEKVMAPKSYTADIVSAQFCIHYAFDSETKVRQLLSNVSNHLQRNGYFIGTTPDAFWLTKKLASVEGKEFGNTVYNVRFEEKQSNAIFGRQYTYDLVDAIQDCPEYLVHFPTFKKLALEYGLKLILKMPFHEYYMENIDVFRNKQLFSRMKVVSDSGKGPSPDEWEAIGMYLVFVFQKL